MNATKPIAAIAALLISFAGLSAVTHYSNAAAALAQTDIHAVEATPAITTLPAIEVVPSAAQLRETARPAHDGTASATRAPMPYYSFAADRVSA